MEKKHEDTSNGINQKRCVSIYHFLEVKELFWEKTKQLKKKVCFFQQKI